MSGETELAQTTDLINQGKLPTCFMTMPHQVAASTHSRTGTIIPWNLPLRPPGGIRSDVLTQLH